MNVDETRQAPDVEAYLQRIGIGSVRQPTLDFLDELVITHQRRVPFENLDVYERGIDPSLAIDDLFEKIVMRKRGGYCFELNGLFFWLLESLGFSARPVMARVTLRGVEGALISHRASIVHLGDADYLADVGFGGPMPGFALRLEDGASRTERGQTFSARKLGGPWWDILYTGSTGEERSVLRPCDLAVEEQDFAVLSFYQSQNPRSPFRLNRMVNVKTLDGAYDVRNMTFTEFHGAQRTVFDLEDAAHLSRILQEKFGIVR